VSPPIALWVQAFAWTLLVEGLVARLWLRQEPQGWVLGWALLASTLTHPALWYLAPRFEPYGLWVVSMELVVTAVEAGVWAVALRRLGRPRPLREGALLSVACNLASWVSGSVLLLG
jgi:hypothetical protein